MDVNITQDSILEDDESFLVAFNTSDPSVIVVTGAAAVMITDDDCKPFFICFKIGDLHTPVYISNNFCSQSLISDLHLTTMKLWKEMKMRLSV